jgi:pimeloyl-ACP methyl ester carboxylesterase
MLVWTKRIFFGVAAVAVLAIVSGVFYEQWSRHEVVDKHPPPGRMVDVDGHKLHLNCAGSGSPTVILESGGGWTGSLSFVLVQPEIAKSHRVCSYDRAGTMWSERGHKNPSVTLIADSLHELLRNASESPPYIMVGYSLGGLMVREYASRYPLDVQGMVLVESSHPEQEERYASITGSEPYEYPRWTALKERALAEVGAMRLLGMLAYEHIPSEAMISNEFLPYSNVAYQREITPFFKNALGAKEMSSLGDMPLIVLTGEEMISNATPEESAEMSPDEIRIWDEGVRVLFEMREELAALSTNSEHRVVEGAGHSISYDAPEAVVRAVNDVAQLILIAAEGDE